MSEQVSDGAYRQRLLEGLRRPAADRLDHPRVQVDTGHLLHPDEQGIVRLTSVEDSDFDMLGDRGDVPP